MMPMRPKPVPGLQTTIAPNLLQRSSVDVVLHLFSWILNTAQTYSRPTHIDVTPKHTRGACGSM